MLDGVTTQEAIPVVLTREFTDLEQVNPDRLKTLVIFDDCASLREDQSAQCELIYKGSPLELS